MNLPVARKSSARLSRRQPLPHGLQPMLATLVADLPRDPRNWGFEFKWDGVRALYYWDGQVHHIESRNQLDITHRYPELIPLSRTLGRRRVILDGEIVALDDTGRPSFQRLAHRMHIEGGPKIQRLAAEVPVWYIIFDVLHLDAHSTMGLGYLQRRKILDSLNLAGPAWQISPVHVGRGNDMLESARQQALEGIIAKRTDSPYEPGRRSRHWLKIKIISRQEFVIGGWVPERGVDKHRVGSLLLGYYDTQGQLRLAGGVGTGFDDQWHRDLTKQFHKLRRSTSPFADRVAKPQALFVRPEIVAEVEYRRWPRGASLQQAAFKGIRTDKRPQEVRDERSRAP